MVYFLCKMEHSAPALTVKNKDLEAVAHKVLGVTIQSNLKRNIHVNEIVLVGIRHWKGYIFSELLNAVVYLPLISLLCSYRVEYMDTVVLCGFFPQLSERIYRVQKCFLCII